MEPLSRLKIELSQAVPEFQTAVRLRPDYTNARFNLGIALASLGRFDEAIPQFSEILRLKPDFTEARASLERCIALRNGGAGR